MKDIIVSNVTYQMIMSQASHNFKQDGRQLPDGNWTVPIEDETYDRVLELQTKGEDIDDTIQRAFFVATGAAKN